MQGNLEMQEYLCNLQNKLERILTHLYSGMLK